MTTAAKSHPDVRALIDEAADLHTELGKLKLKEEKLRLLKGQIVELLRLKPDTETTVSGRKATALIGRMAEEREIADMTKVLEMLGRPRFLQLCKMPLGSLDGALTEDQVGQVTKKARTGRREWKFLPGKLAA